MRLSDVVNRIHRVHTVLGEYFLDAMGNKYHPAYTAHGTLFVSVANRVVTCNLGRYSPW
jgi:hypothetical protein